MVVIVSPSVPPFLRRATWHTLSHRHWPVDCVDIVVVWQFAIVSYRYDTIDGTVPVTLVFVFVIGV